MLGNGYPLESFKPVRHLNSQTIITISKHEFRTDDPTWLIVETNHARNGRSFIQTKAWIARVRAAALRVAAMLF